MVILKDEVQETWGVVGLTCRLGAAEASAEDCGWAGLMMRNKGV